MKRLPSIALALALAASSATAAPMGAAGASHASATDASHFHGTPGGGSFHHRSGAYLYGYPYGYGYAYDDGSWYDEESPLTNTPPVNTSTTNLAALPPTATHAPLASGILDVQGFVHSPYSAAVFKVPNPRSGLLVYDPATGQPFLVR